MEENFGYFAERTLGLCAQTFSPIYARVAKQYWDNGTYARQKRNYCETDWERGIYEVYLPTFQDLEVCMKYYRIAIKVVPLLNKEILHEELEILRKTKIVCDGHGPGGVIDSELLCVIAPHLTRRGFLRGRKTGQGYFSAPIISNIPEIAVKRLLMIVAGFLQKRLTALASSFNLESFLTDYTHSNIPTILAYIIEERVSPTIANGIRCIAHIINWIRSKIKFVMLELGSQSQLQMAVETIRGVQASLTNNTPVINRAKSLIEEALKLIEIQNVPLQTVWHHSHG